MQKISMNDAKKIEGGLGFWGGVGIGAIIIFLAGVIDGYVRPTKCD